MQTDNNTQDSMFTNAMKVLSTRPALRRLVLPLLKRFNPGDIHIRHHYMGGRMRLHSFRHKGYWFHGQRREESTMDFFRTVLRPGDTVIEVGGHIGYLSMWFSELVGANGRVVVFEPGQNNLPYLRANVTSSPNVEVLPMAVSNLDGLAAFFEEELTGQNNSLLSDYDQFQANRSRAFSDAQYRQRETQVVRLDTWTAERDVTPDLVKIDIEGAESLALAGAVETLTKHRPLLMVEVTRASADVWNILNSLGYVLFSPEGDRLLEATALHGNVCAAHPLKHRPLLAHWAWPEAVAAGCSGEAP
jgi:FkbM family methyltransferase